LTPKLQTRKEFIFISKVVYFLQIFNDINRKVSSRTNFQDQPAEETKCERFPPSKIEEEIYEEASSQYAHSPEKTSVYQEADTFDRRPSTSKHELSNKVQYVEQCDNDIPEVFTSEDKNSAENVEQQYEDYELPLNQNINQDMQKIFNEIEYTYVDESIKQKKWVNVSVMQKRDNIRCQNHNRKVAQNSMKREVQENNVEKNHNKIHTNKKSRKLAQVALKKKIKSVVNNYSQNGYLAFENFLHVLYMLQITQNIGKLEDDSKYTERTRRVKQVKDSNELEFALQLWNKINCYLFNYVDSAILVDFLMILLGGSKHKLFKAQMYVEEISKSDDLPVEEIQKNRDNNSDLLLDNVWTVEHLLYNYRHKLNSPPIVTRTGFSIDRELKKNKLYNDYFKEYTFRPKITKKAHEFEEKKEMMQKIDREILGKCTHCLIR